MSSEATASSASSSLLRQLDDVALRQLVALPSSSVALDGAVLGAHVLLLQAPAAAGVDEVEVEVLEGRFVE